MKSVIYSQRPIILDSVRINRVHRPCFNLSSHEPPIILHDHIESKKQVWLVRIFWVNKTLDLLKNRLFQDFVIDIHSRLPFFSSSTRSLESPAGSSRSTDGPQETSPGFLLCAV